MHEVRPLPYPFGDGRRLFSDGKLNFIHKLGKTDLTQFMPRSEAESLIEETEAIFDRFGMTAPVFPSDMENAKSIRKEAKKHGIDLLLIRQKHLGSDCLPNHIDGMCEALRERGVSIRTGEDVRHVIVEDGEVRGLITDKGELRCRAAILAPGRVGADWMGDMAKKYGMELQQRGIEVGVRVETHNDVMSDLTNVIYDPTFFVQTQRYDDQTRTFCTNPAGFITLENYQDFVCLPQPQVGQYELRVPVQGDPDRSRVRQPRVRRRHRQARLAHRRRQAHPPASRGPAARAAFNMAAHP